MATRPEHLGPPEFFYNQKEAKKYTLNSHIISVQTQLAERAIELLNLPTNTPCMVLDIGCGSGLSGDVIDECGHFWVGLDISPSMLEVAFDRGTDGDLCLMDVGNGLNFRPGSFDGAISISMLQWLCNADTKYSNPYKRLSRFFTSLYSALARGARAVFQFFPENDAQLTMINDAALRSGFSGGIVVDFPNSTKAKKVYLCLMAGQGEAVKLPAALTCDEKSSEDATTVNYQSGRLSSTHRKCGKTKKKNRVKSKDWILNKKESMRKKGDKQVANDSKYTGRKRGPRF